jgi:hypothetical protein
MDQFPGRDICLMILTPCDEHKSLVYDPFLN